jgi:hypothetical protein
MAIASGFGPSAVVIQRAGMRCAGLYIHMRQRCGEATQVPQSTQTMTI